MMLHNREYTKVSAPAPPPVDLNDKTTPARAALLAGGMVVGAVLFGLGVALTRLGDVGPGELRDVGGWAWLLMGAAIAVAGGVVFGLSLVALVTLVWYELESRRTWQAQVLWERRQHLGLVTQETYRSTDLVVSDPRHVLAAAVALYWQARYRQQDRPWSVRELRRLEVFTDRSATLIGTCSEHQARQLADVLTRAGIIAGRGPRSAGELAVTDADELLERLMPVLARLPAVAAPVPPAE